MIQPTVNEMSESNRPILFVVCNDYGELALAMYLLDRQPFALNATVMLPPRLYDTNRDILPGRTLVYHSVDDIRQEMMNGKAAGILGLFSGYLLPIHRLCGTDELDALLRSAQEQGWRPFTSDPFIGLLENGDPGDLITLRSPRWSLVWAIVAPIEKRRLVRLLTEMHTALKRTPHVYPMGVSPSEQDRRVGTRLHFHNPAFLSRSEQDPSTSAEAFMAVDGQLRWLFILGDQDYTVQEGLYGSRKFRKILIRKLHETLKAGRRPTLIARAKVLNWVRNYSPYADSMELLTHCDYLRFLSLLSDAEYVLYWNATSFSSLLRTLLGKPWYTFDDGHLLRGMNSDYASRISEWFYQGCEPPRLALDSELTSEALQLANMNYLKSGWRVRHGLLASLDPQSLLSALASGRPGTDSPDGLTPGASGSPDQEAQMSEALDILQRLAEIISANGLNGSFVLDTALLAHPKNVIRSAATLMVKGGVRDQAEFARSVAPTLAFFQPGVGQGPLAIDSPGPDGQPWKTAVDAEILVIMDGLPK